MFGGMVVASFIGVLFVPVLFIVFELLAERVLRLIGKGRRDKPA